MEITMLAENTWVLLNGEIIYGDVWKFKENGLMFIVLEGKNVYALETTDENVWKVRTCEYGPIIQGLSFEAYDILHQQYAWN
jgi:hypothetical protein